MGLFDVIRPGRKKEGSDPVAAKLEAEKDQRWQRAKQQAEGGGQTVWDAPIPSSAIPNRGQSDDPYDQRRRQNLERLEMGLPVEDSEIAPGHSLKSETLFNPNVMGNARITESVSEETPNGLEYSGALDPEMDAYIQTQMAEAQAAELAKDQDRKPVVEN